MYDYFAINSDFLRFTLQSMLQLDILYDYKVELTGNKTLRDQET